MKTGLPESCAIGVPETAGALLVRQGEIGVTFFRSVVPNRYNDMQGITPAQVSAMLLGAVTGWHSRLVDTDLFEPNGLFISPSGDVALCATWCAAHGFSGKPEEDASLPAPLAEGCHDFIYHNRAAFMASVRWRSHYFDEARRADKAFGHRGRLAVAERDYRWLSVMEKRLAKMERGR